MGRRRSHARAHLSMVVFLGLSFLGLSCLELAAGPRFSLLPTLRCYTSMKFALQSKHCARQGLVHAAAIVKAGRPA